MLVSDLVRAMESIAPLALAESWDRVGLLVGRGSAEIRGPVLLTIDLTERVMDEAARLHASAIVAYHPPIWEPITRLGDATPAQRVVLRAVELGIAVYSPHTALDAAVGGITDWLCEGLSNPGVDGDTPRVDAPHSLGATGEVKIAGDCRALVPIAQQETTQQVKIVTFVPQADVDKIRNALASAGAGIVGHYSVCSFAVPGLGTFLAGDHSKPTVGSVGQLESLPEYRLEMVCSHNALPLAIETLRRFHPYEEPAFDVYTLLPKPTRAIGAGRRLRLDHPVSLAELADRLKRHLHRSTVRVAPVTNGADGPSNGGADLSREISIVGVCPGAGASLAKPAINDGCQVFVTGEMKHHEILACLNAGMSVILGEHTSTERGYLHRLAARLRTLLGRAEIVVSTQDIDPLIVV